MDFQDQTVATFAEEGATYIQVTYSKHNKPRLHQDCWQRTSLRGQKTGLGLHQIQQNGDWVVSSLRFGIKTWHWLGDCRHNVRMAARCYNAHFSSSVAARMDSTGTGKGPGHCVWRIHSSATALLREFGRPNFRHCSVWDLA